MVLRISGGFYAGAEIREWCSYSGRTRKGSDYKQAKEAGKIRAHIEPGLPLVSSRPAWFLRNQAVFPSKNDGREQNSSRGGIFSPALATDASVKAI